MSDNEFLKFESQFTVRQLLEDNGGVAFTEECLACPALQAFLSMEARPSGAKEAMKTANQFARCQGEVPPRHGGYSCGMLAK